MAGGEVGSKVTGVTNTPGLRWSMANGASTSIIKSIRSTNQHPGPNATAAFPFPRASARVAKEAIKQAVLPDRAHRQRPGDRKQPHPDVIHHRELRHFKELPQPVIQRDDQVYRHHLTRQRSSGASPPSPPQTRPTILSAGPRKPPATGRPESAARSGHRARLASRPAG